MEIVYKQISVSLTDMVELKATSVGRKIAHLVHKREWILRGRLWPSLVRLAMKERQDVFPVFGKFLRPVVQE